jgi:hypothetical protein
MALKWVDECTARGYLLVQLVDDRTPEGGRCGDLHFDEA